MSLLKPKLDSSFLAIVFSILVGAGDICLIYFSLKNLIKFYSQIEFGLILGFLLANSIFSFGTKFFSLLLYALPPSKSISIILNSLSFILSMTFCIAQRFIELDLIALIFGLIINTIIIFCQFEQTNQLRKISSISIVYEI
jgi:hypothetical protein